MAAILLVRSLEEGSLWSANVTILRKHTPVHQQIMGINFSEGQAHTQVMEKAHNGGMS